MKQPSGWYGGFLKPLRNASTEADVESNYSKGVAYVTERYKNHKGAANIIKDRTKKFDLERTKRSTGCTAKQRLPVARLRSRRWTRFTANYSTKGSSLLESISSSRHPVS
jgi:hypothetical protein